MKKPAFAFSEKGYKALEKIYNAHLGKDYAGDILVVNITGHTETYRYSKSDGLLWNWPRALDEKKRVFNFCDDSVLSKALTGLQRKWQEMELPALQRQQRVLTEHQLINRQDAKQWDELLDFGCSFEPVKSTSPYGIKIKDWMLPHRNPIEGLARGYSLPGLSTRNNNTYWKTLQGFLVMYETRFNDFQSQYSGTCFHLFCLELPKEQLLRLVHLGVLSLSLISKSPQIPAEYEVLQNHGLLDDVDDRVQGLRELPLEFDWRTARLPKLSLDMLSDPNRGYWELFGQNPVTLQDVGLRARDPRADLQDSEVAIDFGTSSTVVALTIKGRKEVLRIGATDYDQAVQPHDFENPTVLELVDLEGMLSAWNGTAYRPPLRWDHVRCAHEAQQSLRNNQSDPQRVASIMTRLKQWARRESNAPLLQLSDQVARRTLALPTLKELNPSQHQLMEVNAHYDFDPIELYAYFLGLYINWRQRGIYSRYVLSFPVRYKSSVKKRILASFRRGLQRSWPLTLAAQPDALRRFVVREGASEPAAYAAAAMPALKLRPGDPGLAYGVFDFGGGTTDFDFGLYRKAITQEEKDQEYSEVFEHFGASGDNDLGGESLLEILAFRLLQNNRDACAEKRLCFAHPPVSLNETGLESLLADSQTATTNTVLLVGQLREFWQNHGKCAASSEGVIKALRLIDRNGLPQSIDLVLNEDALALELAERITNGVIQFLSALKDAFIDHTPPKSIHVLLAGNSCRTRWVGLCFSAIGQIQNSTMMPEGWLGVEELAAKLSNLDSPDNANLSDSNTSSAEFNDILLATSFAASIKRVNNHMEKLFGSQPPVLLIHPPLPSTVQMEKPSAKTGVAWGLLRLSEGGAIHVLNQSTVGGEARFAYFVGKDNAGFLDPVVRPTTAYRQWQRLGLARESQSTGRAVLTFYYTTAPEASSGELAVDSPVVQNKLLEFAISKKQKPVWLRPLDPDTLEVCCQENQPTDDEADVQVVCLG